MNVESMVYEQMLMAHDFITIFKVIGFILIIVVLVCYVKWSINNLKEEIEEKIEGLVRKD